jgi:type VI secretion system protein ImpA
MPETPPLPPELQALLEPASANPPCGEDLWFQEGRPTLQQPIDEASKGVQRAADGTPIDTAEPNWIALCDVAISLMDRSRDLRTGVLLCLALFKTKGLPGFRDGVVLLHGLMEKYWDQLHPLPDGADDPVRGEALTDLSERRFITLLREAPLCRPAGGAAYSLADIEVADSGKAPEEPGAKPFATREQIAAVFAANKPKLEETRLIVSGILEEVKAIETVAASKGSGVNRPDLEKLKATLEKMEKETKDPETAAAPAEAGAAETEKTGSAPAGGGFVAGAINSREQVDAALAAVCKYFQRYEPASPVPLLLERARRLLKLNFLESLRELAPDSVEKFHPLFGTKEPVKTEETT